MRESAPTVRPSVLDRLVDLDPRTSRDPEVGRAESEARYRASVLRDLEWLLNTRRTTQEAPSELREVHASVHRYGVPDVTSLSADSGDSRKFLQRQVEEAIRLFEPRLVDIQVRLVENEETGKRAVRLRIEGTLLMDPDPERIVFDTVLETASGAILVEE